MTRHTPALLLALYVLLFALLAIHPYDRTVWWAENLPILAIVVLVTILHRRFQFSPLACGLMAVLVYLHTIGGHFTFSRVPFGWITETFDFQRNHYDRVAHFSVGFYAYAIAEVLLTRGLTRSRFLLFSYPLCFILAVAAGYEVFEWQFAVLGDPSAGVEVLGSQGDVWDAQRDMLADGLGALAALALFAGLRRREIARLGT
jgi:putative membrane protein